MSRRKRHAAHANHERWLVSYADFITLLFAVFVVLYAAAHADNNRMGAVSHSIKDAFQSMGVFHTTDGRAPTENIAIIAAHQSDIALGESKPNTRDLRKQLSEALAPEIAKKQAELRDGPDGLVISLQEIGFYDQGSDVLKEASLEPLSRVAAVLKPADLHIRIEGHTDNVPIHNARFASNWELSSARATGLVRLFIEQYGLDPQHMAAAAYAEYHPVQSNATEAGRSLNRRVDIVVLDRYLTRSPSAAPAAVSALQQAAEHAETNSASLVTKPTPNN
jgi:chemotaxis protein MotB